MALELRVIRAIIDQRDSGSMERALRMGLSSEAFRTLDGRMLWGFIINHYRNQNHYHAVPSLDLVREHFPKTELPEAHDPIEVLGRELKTKIFKTVVRNASERVLSRIDEVPPEAVLAEFTAAVAQVKFESKQVRTRMLGELFDEHFVRAYFNDDAMGFKWPWKPLNDYTVGIPTGQTTIIYGRPASQKSWLMCYIIATIIEDEFTNARIVVNSADMPEDQYTRYVSCCIAKVSVDKFLKKRLSKEDIERVSEAREMIRNLEKGGGFLRVVSAPGIGAEELQDIVEETGANILFVDGVYRMKDDRTGRLSREHTIQCNIIQGLKDIGLTTGVPVVATTQANREGEKSQAPGRSMTEQAFTDAVAMEASIMVRTEKLDVVDGSTDLALHFPKSRESKPLDSIRIGGVPATDYRYKGKFVRPDMDVQSVQRQRAKGKKEEMSKGSYFVSEKRTE